MIRGEIYLQRRLNSVAALLVVSNNACNRYSEKVTCVPIARTVNRNMPTHVVIPRGSFSGNIVENSIALCEKVQMINKSALEGPVARIDDPDCMRAINHALQVQIGVFEAYEQPCHFCAQEVSFVKPNDVRPLEMPANAFPTDSESESW